MLGPMWLYGENYCWSKSELAILTVSVVKVNKFNGILRMFKLKKKHYFCKVKKSFHGFRKMSCSVSSIYIFHFLNFWKCSEIYLVSFYSRIICFAKEKKNDSLARLVSYYLPSGVLKHGWRWNCYSYILNIWTRRKDLKLVSILKHLVSQSLHIPKFVYLKIWEEKKPYTFSYIFIASEMMPPSISTFGILIVTVTRLIFD